MTSLRKLTVTVAALALFPATGLAQEKADAETAAELSTTFFRLWGDGAFLEAIAVIEDGWEDDPRVGSSYVQMRPALDGFVVLTKERRTPLPPVDPDELARYDGAVAADAITEIVERAKATRIVILNETHDNPRDRAFVLAVAEALRPLGYTHYAAEALQNWGNEEQVVERMEALAALGYPRKGDGWYVTEPMFGNLVRGVLALGYHPRSYEFSPPADIAESYSRMPMEEQVALRERGQAENLARAIAEAGPEAKFLIHVGYSHATERPMPIGRDGKTQEWMAAQLARTTGIDPLTIDQTDVNEFSNRSQTRSLHAALAARVHRPTIFLAEGQPVALGPHGDATDLQVVHPLIRVVNGRPDWLQGTGRQTIEIPAELLPASGRRLIQAFAAAEAVDAIPIDQVLVKAGDEPPAIHVPEGMAIRWAVQEGF